VTIQLVILEAKSISEALKKNTSLAYLYLGRTVEPEYSFSRRRVKSAKPVMQKEMQEEKLKRNGK